MSSLSDHKPIGMADLLHCMQCFVRPADRKRFFIGSCGHVFCESCLGDDLLIPWSTCRKCNYKEARFLEINSSLPPEVRELFLPLEETLQSFMKDFTRALDFQEGHRKRLIRHLRGTDDEVLKLQKFCISEAKKKEFYRQEVLKLQDFKKKIKNEIGRLYSISKARKSEELNTTNISPGVHALAQRTDSGFVTSTPIPTKSDTSTTSNENASHIVADFAFRIPTSLQLENDQMKIATHRVSTEEPPPLIKKYASLPELSKKRTLQSPEFVKPLIHLPPSSFKTPTTKKSKLDVAAFAKPFALSRRC